MKLDWGVVYTIGTLERRRMHANIFSFLRKKMFWSFFEVKVLNWVLELVGEEHVVGNQALVGG